MALSLPISQDFVKIELKPLQKIATVCQGPQRPELLAPLQMTNGEVEGIVCLHRHLTDNERACAAPSWAFPDT
jgi:hypothetical protein